MFRKAPLITAKTCEKRVKSSRHLSRVVMEKGGQGLYWEKYFSGTNRVMPKSSLKRENCKRGCEARGSIENWKMHQGETPKNCLMEGRLAILGTPGP